MKNLFCGSVYVRERLHRGILFARAMREFRGALLVAAALALFAPFAAFAQTSAVPARIVTQVNESTLTTLHGNTHPLARAQYDQGAVADSMPMHRMLLLLQRSPQQETALRTLIDQQQSKTSPSFHQWLTPQQFGQQYGAAPADIQTVTSWLTSHGFQVARVSTAGTLIEFSGTAGQVLNAFHTQIHRYVVNGEEHFANASDPQIPTALASVVAGPVSLHNFPRKAQSHVRGVFQKDRSTGKITPVPSPTFSFNSSDCTSNSIFSSNCNALGPGDFAAIYNENPLLTTGISGHIIDGMGQTIAIVGDSEICTMSSPDFSTCPQSGGQPVDDVANFRSLFGLSTTNLPTVILDGPDPGFNGDEVEGDLDVQWSGAIAPNATIDFVIAEGTEVSAGTDLAAEYIVDNNLAPVLSESFSQCEAFLLANGNTFESDLWEQAAAQGITVVVSAGDSGSAGCDNQDTQTSAVNGANVNGIASTPFNVAAGGTDFDFTATGYPTAFWSTSNAPTTEVSATGYIPETTWNDSCARSGLTGCNSLAATSPLLNINGGGGGQSSCVAAATDINGNISCPVAFTSPASITGWPKPAYQPTAAGSGLTAGNDLTRDVPDVSLFASDGLLSNSFYIVCDSDISGGPCNLSQSFINFVGVGGTSSSAPAFAGIMALVNQNMVINNSTLSPRQGNANYVLYSLASSQSGVACNSSSSPNSSCIFNDITKGNNSVPCSAGSFNCSNAGATGLGIVETGTPANTPSYITGAGFDLATGLGSINVTNLVNNWPTPAGAGSFTPTTTTLCLSTTSGACPLSTTASTLTATVTHGTTVFVNIGVTSGSGAPPTSTAAKPEDVALIGSFTGGSTPGVDRFDANTGNVDIYQLTSGNVSASTNELIGGTYTISARYGGDGKFGSSSSTPGVSIDVVPENSTTSLSVFAASGNSTVAITSVPYGAFDTIRVDVRGQSSGLETGTGTVTLLDNGNPIVTPFDTTSNSFPLNTEGYTEDQTTFLSVGAHSFTGTYAGDASYNASAISTAVPLTVTLGPTTSTVHSSVTSVAPNTNFTLTAFIDTQSSANPTGGSQGLSPSGTVTFFSGTTQIGAPVPVTAISGGDANGFDESTATLSTAQLAATGTITAVYNGDVNYSTSTSPGVTITVTNGATFNLSPANNGVMTVGAPGQSGTDTITITGSGGFAGTITLSSAVSMTPPSAVDSPTCTFGAPDQNFTAPGTITLSTTSETGSATMTCATTAAAHVLSGPSNRPSNRVWPLAGLAISLAGIFFLLMVPTERRWKLVPLAILLAVVAAAGISCSGGGSGLGGGGGNPGTTTGTYTFTVTATPSTGTAQTTAITVNVQ